VYTVSQSYSILIPLSFFDSAERIAAPDYIPLEADIFKARTKTGGIKETRFMMGQLSIHLFDLEGQSSQRNKWIHQFENVSAIIFVVNLAEYDQLLLEDTSQSRLMDSLVIFDSVVNSRWFMGTSVILLFNNIGAFQGKLARSPLSKFFPDYSGGNDVSRAAKYILWRFNQVNRAQSDLYPHFVDVEDKENVRVILSAIKETILQNALRFSNF
jgi:guanine nucleotide-binding protein G(i) subunit alpha